MNSLARRVAHFTVISLLLFVVGCAAEPTERYVQAQAAAADKNLDNFTKFFTRDSAIFLRNMDKAGSRSRIPYIKDTFSILPEGDVEDVLIDGNSAVLKVKGRSVVEVRMFMENDEWSIDVFSLPSLLKPLGGAQ